MSARIGCVPINGGGGDGECEINSCSGIIPTATLQLIPLSPTRIRFFFSFLVD